jgi:hypothetical protein
MATKVYFFAGSLYVRYDKIRDTVDDGYPLPIAGNWAGMAEAGFANRLDAALNWQNGKVYFFRGAHYVRYDVSSDKVDEGYPLRIADHWRRMRKAGFARGLDAAVNWGNGKVYFFRAAQYVRYDVSSDKVDEGYPLPIAGNWPGMAEAGFADHIDAVLPWDGGKVYFFREDQYVRYDVASDKVDDGYPLSIADQWSGMAEAGFANGITAATDLFIENP